MSAPERVAIVMSRLPRLISPHAPWLAALRATIARVKASGDCLVVMPHTAGWELVLHAARRSQLAVDVLSEAESEPSADPDPDDVPLRDRQLLSAATVIVALQIRTNGNVHRGLRGALAAGQRVDVVDGLSPSSVTDDLVARGAFLLDQHDSLAGSVDGREEIPVFEVVPFPPDSGWTSLTHTTRACPGPWPGQAVDDYLDDLLEPRASGDHSAVAVLERIVRDQCLLASGAAIRAGHPVVCFTEVPLGQLPELHRFRPHRTRWDFEPFGICIDRDWLQSQGTQPVTYGDDETWTSLEEPERYRFQRAVSQTPTSSLEWTREREWRHAGDLDLSTLPADRGLVFVPDAAAARRIAGVSRWPITLWPAEPR